MGKNSFKFVATFVVVVVVVAIVVVVVVTVADVAAIVADVVVVVVVVVGTVAICFFHAGNCISGSKLLRRESSNGFPDDDEN